jgi:hypothetical protein
MLRSSPKTQLSMFLAKYTPAIQKQAKEILRKMRGILPGALEMVYDNYNALVIGFGPTERPSEAVFSVVLYPRHISLCFLQGAMLVDTQRRLNGSGNQVRHIRLQSAATLDEPAVQALMAQAIEKAPAPFAVGGKGKLIIRSISAKQRPRQPT